MNCSYCKDAIDLNSIRQGSEMFCSLECANLAAGYDTNSEDSYYEEESLIEEHFENYEE